MRIIVVLLTIILALCGANSSHDFARQTGRFSLNLYKTLAAGRDENVIISPLSVHKALSLLYLGAGGETAAEMADIIQLDSNEEQVAENYKTLLDHHANSGVIKMANKIYFNTSVQIKPEFQQLAATKFYSGADNIDTSNGTEAANIINSYVEQKTNYKICNFVSAKDVQDAVSVIVNTIYFHAKWASPFKKYRTLERDFWISKMENTRVETMAQTSFLPYAEFETFRAVKLSYRNSDFSFLIILPNEREGLKVVEEHITELDINDLLGELRNVPVNLRIPKFKVEYKTSLSDALHRIGLEKLFSDHADFGKIASRNAKIADVLHKAVFAIDEDGTEAAAVTSLMLVSPASGLVYKKPAKRFIAEHPFLYMLIDSGGHIFFIGRYVK